MLVQGRLLPGKNSLILLRQHRQRIRGECLPCPYEGCVAILRKEVRKSKCGAILPRTSTHTYGILVVHLSPCLHQKLYHLQMTLKSCPYDGRLSILRKTFILTFKHLFTNSDESSRFCVRFAHTPAADPIHVGPTLHQDLYHLQVTVMTCLHQRRGSILCKKFTARQKPLSQHSQTCSSWSPHGPRDARQCEIVETGATGTIDPSKITTCKYHTQGYILVSMLRFIVCSSKHVS